MSSECLFHLRFSRSLRRTLWIGVAMSVCTLTAAMAAEPADDDVEEDFNADAPAVAERAPVAATNVYVYLFGQTYDANLARGQLDTLLRQKIATIDVICELTDEQQRKLQLSGRGDIKRLIDRLEEIGARLKLAGDERAQIGALLAELKEIKLGLKSEFADDGSLLGKVLKRILTAEQNARVAMMREIERAGGHVYADSIGLRAVLEISLSNVPFVDSDLSHLKMLSRLQGLNLSSTSVTDAGLVHLQGMTSLKSLDLTRTKVTDAGLAALTPLQALRRLELIGTQVTAAGLVHLSALTGLNELNLSDTRVADAGLAHLSRLKKLQSLNLHRTRVTDAGMVNLTNVTNLEWLDISGTRVSDAGLRYLQELRNLQWVNLSGTPVTDAGLADLKLALPTANIWKRADQRPD
ncbi:MAG TPA: hypothetical protein VGM05_03695 [Planctomycetaceae bacterium]|jgi:hypothetical protein